MSATEETRLPDGALMAQRDAPVGGQAILEGVMMRGVRHWAVAVRKPAPEDRDAEGKVDAETGAHGDIDVQVFPLDSWLKRHRAYRLPVIRGVVALAESLAIGFRALNLSANAQLPEDEEPISGGMWAGTVVVALVFAIGLFFVIPVGLTSLIKDQLNSSFLFWLVEGLVRTGIFLGYLWLLSRLRDLRRVFEYHGAEHKTIACYEAGDALVPERAALYSRLHPRCGTSFLLIVMIVAIFVFAPIGLPAWYWLLATRILGVPLIAGLSFEIIKFAGRNRRRAWVRTVMWPGLQLQKLTTREPDHAQLAVAIASLQAVLDREDPRGAAGDDLVGIEVVA
ncbi:MAG: hypothetical protein QOE86_3423 [Solirubrobacteraceae bacterium]|nr:hypothetical protein [Solirubrobacteraceae bacterium]